MGAELQISESLTFLGGDSVSLAGTVDGGIVVTPELTFPAPFPGAGLATNDQDFEELVVDPGLPDGAIFATTPTTFTAAAAAALTAAVGTGDLANVVSIIRAGAGVDGLE